MSGPEPPKQGLLVIPRKVEYKPGPETLTRTIEIWLVDAGNGASGPAAVRDNGLVIALGFDSKPKVSALQFSVCVRGKWEQPCLDYVDLDPDDPDAKNFAKGLKDLLGNHCPWEWRAWTLHPGQIDIDEPAQPECEGVLVKYTVHGFKPDKARGFHVVPIVTAMPGTTPADHYVLGLAVYTQHVDSGAVTVDDYMTLAYAMKAPTPPALPTAPNCGTAQCPPPKTAVRRQS